MIYLAGPYKHTNPNVMEQRFEALTAYAAQLMLDNKVVFSPITHNHPIAIRHKLPRGWDFWERFDRAFLINCTEMYVLKLTDWELSEGVAAELKIAHEHKIPVTFIDL